MFSLLMPSLRDGSLARPRPVTQARQVLLVAILVILIGYPVGRWVADRMFISWSESAASAILSDAILIEAVRKQNTTLAGQTQQGIDAIDKQWIEERKNPEGALTSAMLASPASLHLQSLIKASHATVTQAILMDAKGRNVAIGAPTTDYWQGDEAKFLNTVARSSAEVDRGDIERRHDGKGRACWLSRTLFADGKPIGALAVEVNLMQVPDTVCAAR